MGIIKNLLQIPFRKPFKKKKLAANLSQPNDLQIPNILRSQINKRIIMGKMGMGINPLPNLFKYLAARFFSF